MLFIIGDGRMEMTKLVLIHKNNIYSFYEGRTKIATVSSAEPLDKETLEAYRKNPKSLFEDATE